MLVRVFSSRYQDRTNVPRGSVLLYETKIYPISRKNRIFKLLKQGLAMNLCISTVCTFYSTTKKR